MMSTETIATSFMAPVIFTISSRPYTSLSKTMSMGFSETSTSFTSNVKSAI